MSNMAAAVDGKDAPTRIHCGYSTLVIINRVMSAVAGTEFCRVDRCLCPAKGKGRNRACGYNSETANWFSPDFRGSRSCRRPSCVGDSAVDMPRGAGVKG